MSLNLKIGLNTNQQQLPHKIPGHNDEFYFVLE
jgi:hypothetical protein